jgi:single-strand DNA-binding protein
MLNRTALMGRFTHDPEMKRTPTGVPVASFSLAVERDFKDANGEKQTDFIDCVAWRNTAEFICKYFTKGRMAVIDGRLQVRTWKDKDGKNRRTTEVVVENAYFADSKMDAANTSARVQPQFTEIGEEFDDDNLPY